MNVALLRLAAAEVRRAWLRSVLAAMALALALLALAFFGREVEVGKARLAAYYADSAATRFLLELNAVDPTAAERMAEHTWHLPNITAASAWIDGNAGGIRADTSFLVFANQRQRESLGARTAAIGVGEGFDLRADYITRVGEAGPAMSIPLLPVDGEARAPRDGEVLVAADIADYVGVRPGAVARVELRDDSVDPPIVRQLDNLRVIGTFDVVGPDRGRFEPFWQLAEADQTEVLTVRHSNSGRLGATTVPIILPAEVMRDFVADNQRGHPGQPALAERLTLRASMPEAVPRAESTTAALLSGHGLAETCNPDSSASFCIRVPASNNFAAALQQTSRFTIGTNYFSDLLLLLIAMGSGALQLQAAVARWLECGLLRALGFSDSQVMLVQAAPLAATVLGGLALGLVCAALAGLAGSPLWRAMLTAVVAALLGAAPGIIFPAITRPAVMLREFA
jgi:hypothetical protein